jgi:hypothetical protein
MRICDTPGLLIGAEDLVHALQTEEMFAGKLAGLGLWVINLASATALIVLDLEKGRYRVIS